MQVDYSESVPPKFFLGSLFSDVPRRPQNAVVTVVGTFDLSRSARQRPAASSVVTVCVKRR